MQSHKLSCLLGSPFARRAAALSIAGFLLGSSAFAVPASIDLPGDRAFPENIISTGVATPKKHLGAMPPMGGSPLSAADLKTVRLRLVDWSSALTLERVNK